MRTYLFIVRQFNDIDHLTPLVDHLLKEPDVSVAVYFSNHNNYRVLRNTNENLAYLRKNYRLLCHSLLEAIKLSPVNRLLLFICNVLTFLTHGRSFKARELTKHIMVDGTKHDPEWSARLIQKIQPAVVIVDWMSPDHYSIKPLIKSAKADGIPVISVPHGLNVYMTTSFAVDDRNDELKMLANEARVNGVWFDFTISQGPISTMHLLELGYTKQEIVELGSMRFSREWLQKYPEIIAQKMAPEADRQKKVNVVVFFSKLRYNADAKKIAAMVEALAAEPIVHLILKPHTRGMELHFLKDIVSRYQIEEAYETSSLELSSWCDIAIVWGSSIGLQILHDRKVLIEPLFVDANESAYERYETACLAHSTADIKRYIKEYQKARTLACYTNDNVDALFRDIVYAGDLNRNVINDYASFLESITTKN